MGGSSGQVSIGKVNSGSNTNTGLEKIGNAKTGKKPEIKVSPSRTCEPGTDKVLNLADAKQAHKKMVTKLFIDLLLRV